MTNQELWPGMMVDDFNRICRYIRNMADTLGFGRWLIRVINEPYQGEDDASAEIKAQPGYMGADIRLWQGFMDMPLREKRHVLIHELCHLASYPIKGMIAETLPILIGEPAFHALWEPFKQAEERMTDNWAYTLGELVDDVDELKLLCHNGRPNPTDLEYINQLKER